MRRLLWIVPILLLPTLIVWPYAANKYRCDVWYTAWMGDGDTTASAPWQANHGAWLPIRAGVAELPNAVDVLAYTAHHSDKTILYAWVFLEFAAVAFVVFKLLRSLSAIEDADTE